MGGAGRGQARRVRHRRRPPHGSGNRRVQPPLLTPDACRWCRDTGACRAIVYRPGDARFEGTQSRRGVASAVDHADCVMVNRNAGSGTRILIDQLLGGAQARRVRRRRPSRTTRSRRPSRRAAPIGAWRSTPSPSNTDWRSFPCRKSNTTSSFRRRVLTVRPSRRLPHCSQILPFGTSFARSDFDCLKLPMAPYKRHD